MLGDPININPTLGIDLNIEDELKRIEELRKKKMRPGFSDAMLALGSTLSSLGSGGRVPNNAAEILARGRANAQADYERQLELEQRQQALRYISKTGNPELMAAYQAGMDPSKIIGYNFEEKMAEKKRNWDLADAETRRGWEIADAKTKFDYEMKKQAELQKLQLENDPGLAKVREELARNQAFFTSMFGTPPGQGPDTGGVADAGITSTQPVVTPPPYSDNGPIPSFTPTTDTATEAQLPQVKPMTVKLRVVTGIPDLTDAEGFGLAQAAAASGQEGFVKERADLLQRRLQQAQIDKPFTVAPNQDVFSSKDNKVIYHAPDAPQDLPASIVEAEYLKAHPELSPTWMAMKQAGSNVQTPDQAALTEAYKSIAQKTVPELIKRGRIIGTSGPQIASLRKLIETVPAGMTPDAWIAQNVSGYSGQADAFKSIVLNLAPQTKVEGSGSQSDVEYAGALAMFPKITGTREGNRAILSIIEAKNKVELDSAAAASDYMTQKISMSELMSRLNEINSRSILSEVPDEVKALIQQGVKASEEVTGETTPMSEAAKSVGMTQEQWNALTPEQRQEIGD